jgi:putative transposase
MEKKEFYRHILPHFQQPGQAYFVTWSLKDAVSPKALKRYTQKLEELKAQKEFHKSQKSEKHILDKISIEYNSTRKKYIKAYDDLLDASKNHIVDLSKHVNTEIIKETLHFWEGKKLENLAFCIMPNHVHWVFHLFEKDKIEAPVYLQDILYSVKRFSANRINELEYRKGSLWQKESFDTTIRDEKHLYYAIEYTLNNPVSAGLVKEWRDWNGCWCSDFRVWRFPNRH